ncbi:hypothetical protein ACFVXE_04635 [Streptomyces sp. NPDC058231]|uniref:hypothetical protein n=1 Tax=Streptomyces sp. NPDC058231 TaxID=3346392 RepID=UPI0036E021D7
MVDVAGAPDGDGDEDENDPGQGDGEAGTSGVLFAVGGKEFTTPSAMHLLVEGGQIVRMHLYEETLAVDRTFSTD